MAEPPAVRREPIDLAARSSFVHPAALGPGVVLAIGMAAYATFTAFLPDHARGARILRLGGTVRRVQRRVPRVRVVGARLPERLGPRRSVTFGVRRCSASGWRCWPQCPSSGRCGWRRACIGVGSAFMYPSLMALTINRAPARDRPRAIASFTMFFEIGTAAGGLALGAVADCVRQAIGFAARRRAVRSGLWVLRRVVVPGRRDVRRPGRACARPRSSPSPATEQDPDVAV